MLKTKNLVKIYMLIGLLTIFAPVRAMFKYARQPISPLNKQKLLEIKQARKEARTQILKSQRQKQCYDLVMILDDFGDEKVNATHQAIGSAFISFLLLKKFPIIVSRNIVYNVLVQKNNFKKTVPEKSDRLTALETLLNLLSPVNITNDDWHCYDYPESDVMLFIPKNYIKQFEDSPNNIADQMKSCGFDITYLKNIDIFSSETLVSYIEEKNTSVISIPLMQAVKSMFIIPNQPNSLTWNIYLTGHGLRARQIAGLSPANFFEFLTFLQKINCSYLHYCSCYSGGYNQNIVKNELSRLKVNFIVSAQGINENRTYGSELMFMGFSDFFETTEAFFGNPKKFAQERTKQESWQSDPIASIVSTITMKEFLDYTQPFVYIPAVGVFNALTVDKSVKIVTESKVRAHEFENKTMDFTNPSIDTIIVYPNYIAVPIKIKAHTAIVSPQKPNPDSLDIHIFEEIIYEDRLSSVIPNFLSFNQKIGLTTFVIKKLQCLDYHNSGLGNGDKKSISITDMIIWSTVIKEGQIVSVVFNFNKKTYFLEPKYITSKEKDLSPVTFKAFEALPVKEILQIQKNLDTEGDLFNEDLDFIPFLLKVYLDKHGRLSELDNAKTLADIIVLLESTLDTTTRVQKPGSLKEVLEQQQKEIIKSGLNITERPYRLEILRKSKKDTNSFERSKEPRLNYRKQR